MHLGQVDAIGQAPVDGPDCYPIGHGERLQRGLGLSSAQLMPPQMHIQGLMAMAAGQ
jgi:hypothetical protein